MDLLAEPVAVVLGAEGAGLSRLVGERVDVVASIPIHGPVESLNASVAAALAVYEVARMRAGDARLTAAGQPTEEALLLELSCELKPEPGAESNRRSSLQVSD
jgi:tRNA C32,U32 (ribose-2'-O)-methylase TrmJ